MSALELAALAVAILVLWIAVDLALAPIVGRIIHAGNEHLDRPPRYRDDAPGEGEPPCR